MTTVVWKTSKIDDTRLKRCTNSYLKIIFRSLFVLLYPFYIIGLYSISIRCVLEPQWFKEIAVPIHVSRNFVNIDYQNSLNNLVDSHLGDKPSRQQTYKRQANWVTTNWATLTLFGRLGDTFGQLGDMSRVNWLTHVWTMIPLSRQHRRQKLNVQFQTTCRRHHTCQKFMWFKLFDNLKPLFKTIVFACYCQHMST